MYFIQKNQKKLGLSFQIGANQKSHYLKRTFDPSPSNVTFTASPNVTNVTFSGL